MKIISKINEKRYLKQIEPLVDQRLIELGLLKIDNDKKKSLPSEQLIQNGKFKKN